MEEPVVPRVVIYRRMLTQTQMDDAEFWRPQFEQDQRAMAEFLRALRAQELERRTR